MNKIKLLPQDLIAKIAAGEVVERPASVVKELVENSLDAGAKTIKIEIEKCGLKKISVVDDGCGMSKEDLRECHRPHTTSKINSEEDLEDIKSMGFRGEALSSIAAVSDLTIKTKLHDENIGSKITISEREPGEILPVGMASGTQIVVENLFENTPARKKFLKNSNTEFGQILNLVSKIALAFPEVGFSLSHNEKIILDLPKNQTSRERIISLLGKRICSQLMPIDFNLENIKINGFIGTPQIATKARSKQFIFVNNRLIKNVQIQVAVKEAYGTFLESKASPVFLLFIQIPGENIDVNIHPRKEEIKFLGISSVASQIREAVKKTLEQNDLTYRPFSFGDNFLYDIYNDPDHSLVIHDGLEDGHAGYVLRKNTNLWNVKETIRDDFILQIQNTYLIIETEKGVLLIDQHAAHERILYEQFLESFQKLRQENRNYTLERPIIFDLPVAETSILEQNIETFQKLGFEIEQFGTATFKVSSVPEIFKERDVASLIAQVLDDLNQQKTTLSIDLQTERTLAYLACKSAIKAGDPLSQEERKKLIEKLKNTSTGYTCPHGRPAQVEISLSELERLFKRK